MAEDRSSNVDFEDCDQCAVDTGSGVCSNCENDGGFCSECNGTGRCIHCQGTGRRPTPTDPELAAEVEAHGPLTPPESEAPE